MDSDVTRTLQSRGVNPPAADKDALKCHWDRLRLLHAAIEGMQPADLDLPLIFTAEGRRGER